MPWVCIITFTLLSSHLACVLNFPSEIVSGPHNFCLKIAPSGQFIELYQAIVCGETISNPQFLKSFRDSGLMHIMVVSGSHLLTLRSLILWPRLQIPLLILYCCVTNFQPPVVRGIVQLVLQESVKPLNWSANTCVFVSGLLTWSLRPEWISSLSFQLSWMCALALSMTEKRSLLFRVSVLYFCTAIILAQFQWPHPVSILMNATLAPFIGAFLFPVSLLTFAFPFISPLTDFLWAALLATCSFITDGILMFPGFEVGTLKIWILIWFVSLFAQLKRVSNL